MAQSLLIDLVDFFTDTIIVERYLSEDRYGVKLYDTPFSVPAFVHGRLRKAVGQDGRERVYTVAAVLATDVVMDVRSRYTLPTRFRDRQPEALQVDNATDENGHHHTTVYF